MKMPGHLEKKVWIIRQYLQYMIALFLYVILAVLSSEYTGERSCFISGVEMPKILMAASSILLAVAHFILTRKPLNGHTTAGGSSFPGLPVCGRPAIESSLHAGNEAIQGHIAREITKFQEYFQSILDCVTDPVMVLDMDHNVIMMNKKICSETAQMKCYSVLYNRDSPCDDRPCPIDMIRITGRHVTVEHCWEVDGTERFFEINAAPLSDHYGGAGLIVRTSHDVTEKKRYEEHLELLKHFDALTGLPNRVMFHSELDLTIEKARSGGRRFAVLFLDLDQFKIVNDSIGHETGDLLLQMVAARLKGCIQDGCSLFRIGGDEFVVIMLNDCGVQDVVDIAVRIQDGLSHSFFLNGQGYFLTASIGISLYPQDGDESETLIKNADLAMYNAKQDGRSTFKFYSPGMDVRAIERMLIENELHYALQRCEFSLFYQPLVQLKSGSITSMEALLSWNHPEIGMVPPDKFIPAAEETGLIIPIGHWVLYQACMQNKLWQESGLPPVRIAVNLSALQFQERNLAKKIRNIMEDIGLRAEWLELEITESTLIRNIDGAIRTLNELNDLGLRVSIDDFGTGYSSLNYLRRLPINSLKVDRSFVRDIIRNPDDATIVKAVITMAHHLGLEVVAEGVETREQLEFLRSLECDYIQGRLFSWPLSTEDTGDMLKICGGAAQFRPEGS